jgi:hypothetical protein
LEHHWSRHFPIAALQVAAMTDARPIGFRDYVRSNGLHTVYLLTPMRGSPVKVGISEDPVQRIGTIQAGHYEELVFHRFWWLPGVAVATRIEAAFKRDHAAWNIRGEWSDMSPHVAEQEVDAAIQRLGIWSLTQSQMEHLFDAWMRKTWGVPAHAPSPLPGRAPRTDEPWQRRPKSKREPYKPQCTWERRKA